VYNSKNKDSRSSLGELLTLDLRKSVSPQPGWCAW